MLGLGLIVVMASSSGRTGALIGHDFSFSAGFPIKPEQQVNWPCRAQKVRGKKVISASVAMGEQWEEVWLSGYLLGGELWEGEPGLGGDEGDQGQV